MKEEIYQWMKNLAVFYILFTAVLHLVPDRKYERYVRFFMGVLLIFMLCIPVFSILGKTGELLDAFQTNYGRENSLLDRQEMENLQALYLQQGYGEELRKKILESLQNRGIEPAGVEVHIEGERAKAIIYMEGIVSEAQERGIADGLLEDCRLGEGEYQIKAGKYGKTAVGGSAASGGTVSSGSDAGVR